MEASKINEPNPLLSPFSSSSLSICDQYNALQLGDILRVQSSNVVLDTATSLVVKYIDETGVLLSSNDTHEDVWIHINSDCVLDTSITHIEVLYRPKEKGYARQNRLLPGTWITIEFNASEYPSLMAEIVELKKDEDMIVLRCKDTDQLLYLDFGFKGIPKEWNIKYITRIASPNATNNNEEEEKEEKEEEEEEETKERYGERDGEKEKEKEKEEEKEISIEELVREGNKILLGEDDNTIRVNHTFKTHSLQTQLEDLMDALYKHIPKHKQTDRVDEYIQTVLHRYRQLRAQTTAFDEYGNVNGVLSRPLSYSPLSEWFDTFDVQLYWLLPVAINARKLFCLGTEDAPKYGCTDTTSEDIHHLHELQEDWEQSGYQQYQTELAKCMSPFDEDAIFYETHTLARRSTHADMQVILQKDDAANTLVSSAMEKGDVTNKKCVIARYITTGDETNSDNDVLNIHSFLTMPTPTVLFSRINLPMTDILTRVHLHNAYLYASYWRLLDKTKTIQSVPFSRSVPSLAKDSRLQEQKFEDVCVYEKASASRQKQELYQACIDAIVPNNQDVIRHMSPYFADQCSFSVYAAAKVLEPYRFYYDALTDEQRIAIRQRLRSKIDAYKQRLEQRKSEFAKLNSLRSQQQRCRVDQDTIRSEAKYDIVPGGIRQLSDLELLNKMLHVDFARNLFAKFNEKNSALCLADVAIAQLKQLKADTTGKSTDKDDEEEEDAHRKTCESIVLAKFYTTLEQMTRDNDRTIYFDKRYDTTNYGLLETANEKGGYREDVSRLTVEELRDHIIADQIKNHHADKEQAAYMADTLLDGNKRVLDGQYALLYTGYAKNIHNESEYYKRHKDEWVKDEQVTKHMRQNGNMVMEDSATVCNVQDLACMSLNNNNDNGNDNDSCSNKASITAATRHALLTSMLSEFDKAYFAKKKERTVDAVDTEHMLQRIVRVEAHDELKYNERKTKLALAASARNANRDEGSSSSSPHLALLHLILSQTNNPVKTHRDLVRFCDKYTEKDEMGCAWLVCKETKHPLVPVYLQTLARVFNTPEYNGVLQEVCQKVGTCDDNGNIVDKETGWVIVRRELCTAGNAIVGDRKKENDDTCDTDEQEDDIEVHRAKSETLTMAGKIRKVYRDLCSAMGYRSVGHLSFLVKLVERIMGTLVSKANYKEMEHAHMPYEVFCNTMLVYSTVCVFVVVVQTAMPSLPTPSVAPHDCVPSVNGFPLDADHTDVTKHSCIISYVACLVSRMNGSTANVPWNVLHSTPNPNDIARNIHNRLAKLLDPTDRLFCVELKQRLAEKAKYVADRATKTNTKTMTNYALSRYSWPEFLPPLYAVEVSPHLKPIHKDTLEAMRNMVKVGEKPQFAQLSLLRSKSMTYALAFQNRIQQMIERMETEGTGNTSCSRSLMLADNASMLAFFVCKEAAMGALPPTIDTCYQQVSTYRAYMDSIQRLRTAPLFSSRTDTQEKYPSLPTAVDERTIYMAIIKYCKMKSRAHISDELMAVCGERPETLLATDSINVAIHKLKEAEKIYNLTHLNSLLTQLSMVVPNVDRAASPDQFVKRRFDTATKRYLVNVDREDTHKDKVRDKDTNKDKDTVFDTFVQCLNRVLEAEIGKEKTSANDTNELIDNLTASMMHVKASLEIDLVPNVKVTKLFAWKLRDSSTIAQFYDTYLDNFVNVFPSMIRAKTTYSTRIPKYWKFAKRHQAMLQTMCRSKQCVPLRPFLQSPVAIHILDAVSDNLDRIRPLMALAKLARPHSHDKNDIALLVRECCLLQVMYIYLHPPSTGGTDSEDRDHLWKQTATSLLASYLDILCSEKATVNYSYHDITCDAFRLRQKEKTNLRKTFAEMSPEEKALERKQKELGMGVYSLANQKALTAYDSTLWTIQHSDESDLLNEAEPAKETRGDHNDNDSDNDSDNGSDSDSDNDSDRDNDGEDTDSD